MTLQSNIQQIMKQYGNQLKLTTVNNCLKGFYIEKHNMLLQVYHNYSLALIKPLEFSSNSVLDSSTKTHYIVFQIKFSLKIQKNRIYFPIFSKTG